jgi:hypothetical protein
MEIWTIQLGQWRLAKQLDIPLVDTTYASGLIHNNIRWLAPTGELLGNYKSGCINASGYQQIYLNLMRGRWSTDPEWFINFCRQHERVALACYCGAGDFCHRLLLVDIFRNICVKYNIPFVYHGELKRAA